MNPCPEIQTFEQFVEKFETLSDDAKQYYYHQILFAEKERARIRDKEKRRYEKKKEDAKKKESQ